jgi:hypothetical protein
MVEAMLSAATVWLSLGIQKSKGCTIHLQCKVRLLEC